MNMQSNFYTYDTLAITTGAKQVATLSKDLLCCLNDCLSWFELTFGNPAVCCESIQRQS